MIISSYQIFNNTNLYKEVDYTNVIEEYDNVKPIQEIACSGGTCEII